MNKKTAWGVGLAIAGTVGLAALVPASAASPAQGAKPTQDVTVTNTTDNPVPVAVTNSPLSVTGTVNIGNLPSTQQVAGSVAINPAGNGVQEANSIATRPFTRSNFTTFGAGNPGAFNAEVDLYTVPAGERVVLTYAGAVVGIPGGEHAIVDLRRGALGSRLAVLPLTDAGPFNLISGATEFLTGGGLVNAVFTPGDHIVVHAFRSIGDGDNVGQLDATVTGYTVPIP